MTVQQDPKHCDHEKVCFLFRYGSIVAFHERTPCTRNHPGCKTCENDTRIKPQSPRPACEECIWQNQSAMQKAQIARLKEVYEKFKHLDTCLGDPEWGKGGETAGIYGIAGKMYRYFGQADNAVYAAEQICPRKDRVSAWTYKFKCDCVFCEVFSSTRVKEWGRCKLAVVREAIGDHVPQQDIEIPSDNTQAELKAKRGCSPTPSEKSELDEWTEAALDDAETIAGRLK